MAKKKAEDADHKRKKSKKDKPAPASTEQSDRHEMAWRAIEHAASHGASAAEVGAVVTQIEVLKESGALSKRVAKILEAFASRASRP